MGRDRYVRWGEKVPTNAEVLATARDFFGPSATEETIGREQYAFRLPMRFSDPKHPLAGCAREDGERCVEVILSARYANIETRMTDRFTDAVADELAATLSWYYGGIIDGGVSQREYARFKGQPVYRARAEALEKAIDVSLRSGVPRDKFAKWVESRGWSRVMTPSISVDPMGREEWSIAGKDGCLSLSPIEQVTLGDVKYLARNCNQSFAVALEEIFGDEA